MVTTILLIIAGIFAGFYALFLFGALAVGWLVQPMLDGFYLNKKYRRATTLKLLVYVLVTLAAGVTLLGIGETVACLLEGKTWERCCGLDPA